MIGPFVPEILVRLEVTGTPHPTFAELAAADALTRCFEAHEHRHVPSKRCICGSSRFAVSSHAPFFQLAIVQHNAPDAIRALCRPWRRYARAHLCARELAAGL